MGWIQHYLLKILNFTRENWVSVHRNGGYIIVIFVWDSCYLAITVNEEIYERRERKKQQKKIKKWRNKKNSNKNAEIWEWIWWWYLFRKRF